MDINTVYNALLQDGGLSSVKATWVGQFVRSPITFWCDLHAPEELKDPVDIFVQHLFETGLEHQINVTQESYPQAVEETFYLEEDGFRRTLELMEAGEKFIKNMPLLCRNIGLEGRPDVLVRVDDIGSNLGEFSYAVVEIKSARRITEAHIMQGAVYNRLLGIVQGYQPEEFYVINRDSDVQPILTVDVDTKLDTVLENVRLIMDGAAVEPCHGTGDWPWESHVNDMAIQRSDVSLIPGVGPSIRENLRASGFRTVVDVATTDEQTLTEVHRVGLATAKKFVSSAIAIQQGAPVRRGPTAEIKRGATEVFFDLEGTDPRIGCEGLEVTNYLIGAAVRRPSGEATYLSFFAPTIAGEEGILREFLSWVASLDDPVLYHWHHYERTHLTKMMEYYGFPATTVSTILGLLVDLSPITTKSFAFPAYGEGLKDIAPSLGFEWRQDDVTALTSVGLYLGYVRSGGNDAEARRKILAYNEDDCLATMYIFDWLLAQK